VIRREFAERVSGRSANVWTHGITDDCPYRGAMSEKGRLSVPSCGELVGRSVEADAAEINAQRGVDFAENAARHGKGFGNVFPHARFLRALAREKKYDIHR
jgi:hypothetical protein